MARLIPQQQSLVKRAREAAAGAHAPASGFKVGAALEAAGGIYTGCNIENSSLSLSVCAERVALFKAASEGEKVFTRIAVMSESEEDAAPCGACRQVMADLAPGIEIIYLHGGEIIIRSIGELLPEPFRFRNDGG